MTHDPSNTLSRKASQHLTSRTINNDRYNSQQGNIKCLINQILYNLKLSEYSNAL